MRKFITGVAAAAMLGLWSGNLAVPASAEALGHKAVKQLFPGSFQAVVSGVVSLRITARSDGSLTGKTKSDADTGRWRVEGGRLCIKFKSWMNGRSLCSPVVLDGEWYRVASIRFRKI